MAGPERFDLVVIGAGPAGCAAAIEARRRGLRVCVVDKVTFPRDKTCGDGLTAGALRLLERLGLTLDALHGEGGYEHVDDVVLVGPDGREVTVPLPRGRGEYAAVVSRLRLDAALVDLARTRGADMRLGDGVAAIEPQGKYVIVDLDGGSRLRAEWVVAADGQWSPTRRMLERNGPRDLGAWHAARRYFTNAGDGRLWVLFERDLLPGYAWVFPLPGGRANVGYGVLRDEARRGRDLKALWADLLERPSIRRALGDGAQPEGTVRAWPIPTDYNPAALHHGRVLFAGDAARVVDPMTGEGIAQALETGMLAASAVATGGPANAVTQRYQASVRRALGRDLRFAARLQRVLASPRGAQFALRAVDTNDWTRRNFGRWMFEDYPRATVLTPDRWRRGRFHADGAFLGAPIGPEVNVTPPTPTREARPMATTHAEVQIAKDADEVWKVFGDFQGIKTWFPGLTDVKAEGADVRVISMGPGMEITETVLSRDDANRTLTYSVASPLLNANKYETTIKVTPGDGGCTATMDAVLDPDSLAELIGPVYENAVQGLADHFK